MCLTNTHHLSLTEEVYDEFRCTWEAMMRNEAKIWSRFHRWWLSCGVPLFVLRYEDLRNSPEEALTALTNWLEARQHGDGRSGAEVLASKSGGGGGGDSDSGPSTEAAFDSVEESGSQAAAASTSPYTPRVGGIGKSLRRFEKASPGLLGEVVALAGPPMLRGFGYHPATKEAGGNGFPDALRPPNYEKGRTVRPGKAGKIAVLNHSRDPELRAADDKFGRYMTVFRKKHTDGDTKPLPVVSGVPYRLISPAST
eukprot:CAMPEP_0172635848 /NCGR_PEP_ID=MMETSP1068-20121228/201215_1 /TAXON_ID=35684 /ORGANISM="Pseudopedinella elastica, Strain CCMP716" /LENGTH=253 /DNA_ID=CAMNT_0013448167 /DNA_START=14 /DNA_END=775 /DNA_ORIENTATION=+